MNLRKALDVSVDEDIRGFSAMLWQMKVPHRITEQDNRLIIWVDTELHEQQVRQTYEKWQAGEISIPKATVAPLQFGSAGFMRQVSAAPVTLLLLLGSVLGFLLVLLDRNALIIQWLTFYDFVIENGKVTLTIPQGQYWRLITPIFLHFGALHIVFNGLWLWDLGRRVEIQLGRSHLLAVVLISALGSNLAQYYFGEPGVFGGMSGVIYALLGYAWLWSVINPQRTLGLSTGIVIMMVAWLIFCMVGMDALFGVSVANGAHVGGLIIGIILGIGSGLIAKTSRV